MREPTPNRNRLAAGCFAFQMPAEEFHPSPAVAGLANLLNSNLHPDMLDARSMTRLHDQATTHWHLSPAIPFAADRQTALHHLALEHHRANFDLWHQEDDARNPDAPDHTIAQVKHAIDRLNQLRNDRVEQIDELLLTEAAHQNPVAPLHSETPGLILDRLSILALKIYHTAEESRRATAVPEHRSRNLARLAILELQREDLTACLDLLWTEILSGRRRFKLYRQMKMYNDPELNPVLYTHASTEGD